MNEFQFLCEFVCINDMTKVQTLHHHRTRSALKSVCVCVCVCRNKNNNNNTSYCQIVPQNHTRWPRRWSFIHIKLCVCVLCVCVYSSYAARLFCCCIIVFAIYIEHTEGTQHKSDSGMYELFWGTLNFCFYILIILMLLALLFFLGALPDFYEMMMMVYVLCVLLCNSYY